MKNILKSSLLLLGAVAMFTACSSDRDSNPTLQQPSTFTLNTPAYAQSVLDLAQSTQIPFTWSQPDYGGFPIVVEYQFEVSKNGNYTVSLADQEADAAAVEAGELDADQARVADYATLDATYTSCKGGVLVSELTVAMQKLFGYEADAVPETDVVYVRSRAVTGGADPVYSNAIALNVNPIYVELKDTPPEIWFLTGAFTGWGNTADGSGMVPMYVNPAETYDKNGLGNIEWVGYLPADGFKVIAKAGLANWMYGMCGGNENGGQTYRNNDKDGGDIKMTVAGYWKLVVNTAAHTMTFEAQDITPKTYETICMPGAYQGWDPAADAM